MRTQIRIGVIGDFNSGSETHIATNGAIGHAAASLGINADVEWLPTRELAQPVDTFLRPFDGLWCAPGSPYQNMQGALDGIQFARTRHIPFIGTCGGFQHAVIEFARNVLGFQDAQHAEYDPYASRLFVNELACSLAGKTMAIRLQPNSRVFHIYRKTEIAEQYYCRFGLNPAYQNLIDRRGLRIVGVDSEGEARILEIEEHPFFVVTLFVPQISSSAEEPHPLIVAYVKSAAVQSRGEP